MDGNVYRCSNGRFYGDVDLWERLESGEWRPFCWDEQSGTEWVFSTSEELLTLEPISPSELPPGLTLTESTGGVRVESASRPARKTKNCR